MYLHLGNEVVIRQDSIIAIFDLDNASQSHLTRKYLSRAEKSGQVINVAEDLPKSFVVCQENGTQKVYLSQLMSATLLKRSETVAFE